MTARRIVTWIGLVVFAAAAVALAAVVVPRWYIVPQPAPAAPEPAVPAAAPKIRARLYYVADDGQRLVAIVREVPFGGGALEQARHLVESEFADAPAPLISPVPKGTTLRAIYLSASGQAYVDLSREVSASHPGGALSELLTVYAIVNVLTKNLPAVTAVQILVDGREVDTLAGHIDLRRPLPPGAAWLEEPLAAQPAPDTQPVQQKSPSWP